MLYIYLPRIRYEFSEFVRLWNAHPIRKQKERPHVVPGKPWVLYHLPDPDKIKDYRCYAPDSILRELLNIIEQDGIDLDEYLPAETMKVCDDIVRSFGGIPARLTAETRKTPFIHQYEMLKHRLRQYIDEGHEPKVGLLKSHTGSLAHLRIWLSERGVNVDELDVESDLETDIDIV